MMPAALQIFGRLHSSRQNVESSPIAISQSLDTAESIEQDCISTGSRVLQAVQNLQSEQQQKKHTHPDTGDKSCGSKFALGETFPVRLQQANSPGSNAIVGKWSRL